MSHIRKAQALLLASSAAKMSIVVTDASAACENSSFGLSVAGNSTFFTSPSSKSDGTISPASISVAKLTSTSTLDFTLTGIESTGTSSVYLAYSTAKAATGVWPASCTGQLQLSSAELEIVYGETVNASEPLLGVVSMGKVLPGFRSHTISIRTDDLLANSKLKNNKLYFQAIVVRGTGASIPDATVSSLIEVDISRPSSTTTSTTGK